MIVRFDNKLLQQTVERKTDPIGVEGDPSTRKGGISEADAIVGEARKGMNDVGGDGVEEGKARASSEMIKEEEEKESGPELSLDASKHLTASKEQS